MKYDPTRANFDPNNFDKPVDKSPRAWIVGIFWLLVAIFAFVGLLTVCTRVVG